MAPKRPKIVVTIFGYKYHAIKDKKIKTNQILCPFFEDFHPAKRDHTKLQTRNIMLITTWVFALFKNSNIRLTWEFILKMLRT